MLRVSGSVHGHPAYTCSDDATTAHTSADLAVSGPGPRTQCMPPDPRPRQCSPGRGDVPRGPPPSLKSAVCLRSHLCKVVTLKRYATHQMGTRSCTHVPNPSLPVDWVQGLILTESLPLYILCQKTEYTKGNLALSTKQ